MSDKDLSEYANVILNHHNKTQNLRFSQLTTEYLEVITGQMFKKKVYKETIEILKILKGMDDCAHVF